MSPLLALHVLALKCMALTLHEIVEHQERLRAEILERECLLAAFNVLQEYAANGQNPKSVDLATLTSALPAGTRRAPVVNAPPAQLPAPKPVPYVKPYIDPELEELLEHNRTHVAVVRWAIERMTDDFSLADIRKLLARAGYSLVGPEISVVLTRLKRQGEIEEIERAHGPTPAMFRKPEAGISTDSDAANAAESTEVAAEPAVP